MLYATTLADSPPILLSSQAVEVIQSDEMKQGQSIFLRLDRSFKVCCVPVSEKSQ